VTVPTPVTPDNEPDLSLVISASELVGKSIKSGAIIVFESTVYPGVTENICGPVIEKVSGLKSGQDFYLGYSPERINPGDHIHTIDKITKVVAGATPAATDILARIYGAINGGNIFKAKDIKTAEASKVIENAQRDINVAFINEITQIMNKLDVSIHDVLESARTKWNFLPFRPGLVGGHCIGVDPYYLARCAQDRGHDPKVILSGRATNDGMGKYLADRLHSHFSSKKTKILILGFTFKENISDVRNTKVADMVRVLEDNGYEVDIHDPHAHADEVRAHYNLSLLTDMPVTPGAYGAVILAVPHNRYLGEDARSIILSLVDQGGILYDIHGLLNPVLLPSLVRYLTI
jgi:UDP-N-acetyl-D-glucosamine/UDP-N-acetyl-D-galactosamine dehydrogenase